MVKIFIDPGHGGLDSGAPGNGLLEKNITLQIALKTRDYLSLYKNVTIKMSRTTDKTVSLKQRTDMANRWGADYFLSIHINSGGGTGFESFIYSGLSNASKTGKIRERIHHKVLKVNELNDRGKKQGNLHVLRESSMPGVLTENGFIDTAADAKKMKDKIWIDKVAKAHADGLAEAFNLQKKASENNEPTNTNSETKSEKYVVKKTVPGFLTALDAKLGTNKRTTVKPGTYFVYKRIAGMINVSNQKNTAGSWINPEDNKASSQSTFKVGQKVKIKKTAKTYATGEAMPAWVKNRTFTIQQMRGKNVLLKEISSWVKQSDITK